MLSADQILTKLAPLADPAYRDSVAYFAPAAPVNGGPAWETLGVSTGRLRRLEKALFAALKTQEDYSAALELADDAFRRRQRELAVMGVEALLKLKKHWRPDLLDHIRNWIPQIADWAICDMVGYSLLGTLLLRGVIELEDIMDLKEHPSIWGQRLLITATILPLRQSFGDPDRYLAVIALFTDRREKMICKAISWALRSGCKTCPDKIMAFLDQYQDHLQSTILREVRTKLTSGVKNPGKRHAT